MKIIITITLLFTSAVCFGQTIISGDLLPKGDTIPRIKANPIQIEKLSSEEKQIQEHQRKFSDILELISGYKIEEIQDWKFENGYFKFYIKKRG